MISPINFRASVGSVELTKPAEMETPKTETVTTPITTATSFKGADALAAYNKAFLAVDGEAESKVPAFKGEEVETQDAPKAPAFKGEEVETQNAPKAPAFKGEEVETQNAPKAPAFKGEGIETQDAPKAPAFKGEEVETQDASKAPAFKGEETKTEETPAETNETVVEEEKTKA